MDNKIATPVPYFDRATQPRFSLINTPGVYPRFLMSLVRLLGDIDLSFASPLLISYLAEWSNPLPSTGSDHIPILQPFDTPCFPAPPPQPNRALTN